MNEPVTIGYRIRAKRWQVEDRGPGYFTDPDTGLIRDPDGTVVSVDDNVTVPPGTEGTVTDVLTELDGKAYQISVVWDNGSRLSLMAGVDHYELVSE